MKKTVNFAIAGYGSIARTHLMAVNLANIFMNLPYEINLKYIVTRTPREIPYKSVENVCDFDEVLNDESIDFIDICTPNQSHSEYILKCIEKNIPFYCEKPVTNSYESTKKIADILSESSLICQMGLMNRFMPCVNMLKDEIESGRMGKIIRFKAKYYHKSYLGDKRAGSWKTRKESGKGAVLDLGIHIFDLINYIFGDIRSAEISEDIFFKERNETDEIAFADIELENGARGSAEMARIYGDFRDKDEIEVYMENGKLSINLSDCFTLRKYDFSQNVLSYIKADSKAGYMKYFPQESEAVTSFLAAHCASIVSFVNRIENIEYEGQVKGALPYDCMKSEKFIWK